MIDRDSIIAWLTDIGQGNTCSNDSEMARETLAHLRLYNPPALTPSAEKAADQDWQSGHNDDMRAALLLARINRTVAAPAPNGAKPRGTANGKGK